MQKTEDCDWALTMGKFFMFDRGAILTVSFLASILKWTIL